MGHERKNSSSNDPIVLAFSGAANCWEDEGSEVTIAFENIPPGIRPENICSKTSLDDETFE